MRWLRCQRLLFDEIVLACVDLNRRGVLKGTDQQQYINAGNITELIHMVKR